MKKYLFLIPVAALAFTACTNETEEYVGSPQAQEIAFRPIAQPTTRAIVEGTDFPTAQSIFVSAYSIPGTGTAGEYFSKVTFSKDGENAYWVSPADNKQYWPLSPATLNFLGVTGVLAANVSSFTSAGATITWTHNASDMYDLMYAVGQGSVSQASGSNSLSYGNNVAMQFKHALAQVAFKVAVGAAGYASKIHVDKIVLNGMVTGGTYTLSNSSYNATGSQSASGTWTSTATADTDVPGSTTFASTDMSTTLTADGQLLVPCKPDATTFNSFTGFTVYFTMNEKQYTYVYTPTDAEKVLTQGKKYIYDLTFTLTEIRIAPSVLDWDVYDADSNTDGKQDIVVSIPA